MPTEVQPHATSAPVRWPRPDALRLHLHVEVGSRMEEIWDEFGWQVWDGDIEAIWDLTDADYPDEVERPTIDQLPFLAEGATHGWAGAPPRYVLVRRGYALGSSNGGC